MSDNQYVKLIDKVRKRTGKECRFHESRALETWVILATNDGKQIEVNVKDLVLEKEIHDENFPDKPWKKIFIYRINNYLFTSQQKIY